MTRSLLQTARLRLDQFREDDAPLLFEMDSDPEVVRYTGGRMSTRVEDYVEAIRTRYQRYYDNYAVCGVWKIVELSTGNFIGWVCLRPGSDYRYFHEAGLTSTDVELGYRLRREAWGRGYATEASRALLAEGVRESEFDRVVATALRDNIRSTNVMRKCGLTLEREFLIDGYDCPAVLYVGQLG